MKGLAVCTIAAGNYLAQVRVLAESLESFHPGLPFYVAVPGPQEHADAARSERLQVLGVEDLGLQPDREFLFSYSRKQMAVYLKPVLLRHLLNAGYESVLFLDPDMLVLGSLDDIFRRIAAHSLTLTPHVRTPRNTEERQAGERQLLMAGIYNGGVIGVSPREETHAFLDWLEARLRTHCYDDLREGIHYDQRWLDLAPAFVSDLHLVRDPGINVAYWNLDDLAPALEAGPAIRLFHFSGYDPTSPHQLSRFVPNARASEAGYLTLIFDSYRKRLLDAGFESAAHDSWPWATFSNGVPIPERVRFLYLSLGPTRDRFGDPFDAGGENSFYNWINEPPDWCPYPELNVSRLWKFIYDHTPGIHRLFPDPMGEDRIHFLRWTVHSGAQTYGIPPELAMPPARRSAAGYVRFTAHTVASKVRRVLSQR